MDPKLTRGYLNNNPGNIDRGNPPWNGEIRDVSKCVNDIQRRELTQGRFCVFVSSAYGIRALALNLRAYRDRLGCKSVQDYINRWAPPNENNTAGYIDRVAMEIGVNPLAQIDINQQPTMKALVKGIINVECAGMPYSDAELDAGLAAAGLPAPALAPQPQPEVKPPSPISSKTIITTATAGAGTVAGMADQAQPTIDAVNNAATTISNAHTAWQGISKAVGPLLHSPVVPFLIGCVVLGLLVYVGVRYLRKMHNGQVIST